MTTLIVIRHGETDWNRQHRFQGQIDVPLNAMGQEQARRLAQRLADEPLDALLASDLLRARSTAQAWADARAARGLGQPLQIAPLWREQGFGVLEGLDVPTIQRQHPELWARWIRHEADFAPPGGESNAQFYDRIGQALEALLQAHRGGRVAVVTHGGVLDMLWRRVHGLPTHGARDCPIPNTGLNRLRWEGGTLNIELWGDDAHLAGLPEQPLTAPAKAG